MKLTELQCKIVGTEKCRDVWVPRYWSCLATRRIPKLFNFIAKHLSCFIPYTYVNTYIQSFKKKSIERVDTLCNIEAYINCVYYGCITN